MEKKFFDAKIEKVKINEVRTIHNEGRLEIILAGCASVILGILNKKEKIVIASHFLPHRHGVSKHYNSPDGLSHLESLIQAIWDLGLSKDILRVEAVFIGQGNSIFPIGVNMPHTLLFPDFYEEINIGLKQILNFQNQIKCVTYLVNGIMFHVSIDLKNNIEIITSNNDHLLLCSNFMISEEK